MLREEKCLEFVFEGRERIRVSDILGEVVPDMRTEIGERAKNRADTRLEPAQKTRSLKQSMHIHFYPCGQHHLQNRADTWATTRPENAVTETEHAHVYPCGNTFLGYNPPRERRH